MAAVACTCSCCWTRHEPTTKQAPTHCTLLPIWPWPSEVRYGGYALDGAQQACMHASTHARSLCGGLFNVPRALHASYVVVVAVVGVARHAFVRAFLDLCGLVDDGRRCMACMPACDDDRRAAGRTSCGPGAWSDVLPALHLHGRIDDPTAGRFTCAPPTIDKPAMHACI